MDVLNPYSEYDSKVKLDFDTKRSLEKEIRNKYPSFYEKFFLKRKISPWWISLVITITSFSIHATAAKLEKNTSSQQIFLDFSFFLSILNGLGVLLLFNASEKLREFVVNLIYFSKQENKNAKEKFLPIYSKNFIGQRSITAGILFGLINMIVAYFFGVGYYLQLQYLLLTSFYLQIFFIGFIGGITVNGFLTVLKLIKIFSFEEDIELKYFYPDQCAGTLIIGHILFLFSIHFIIIGLLIFVFIHNFPWVNVPGQNYYLNAINLIWKLFPFVLSALIFFIPAQKINRILRDYKLYEHLRLRKRMGFIAEYILKLDINENDSTKINNLDNHYQKLKEIESTISSMNTWPYNFQYRAIFLSVFLPGITGIILELSKNYILEYLGLLKLGK